ncbi:hypothetical protein DP144_13845 [Clostridium tetani]|uniref:helix-turn-helix domain-containing protein n=1 Tax=Clostridium tetani TaxID=1513 RepID=UPI00100ADFEE|nr:helix-turn-helix domain-containing protein [Clostridium tetani]RXM73646.1 hypothetical protein DP154_13935 [Clostridium tetani]RYU97811.1 hypothetical protein DP144_13845 [Clostridium tetani]
MNIVTLEMNYNNALERIKSQQKKKLSKEIIFDIKSSRGQCLNLHTGYELLIDEKRIEKYFSVKVLSKETSISRRYISDLCSGLADNPSIYVLTKIAKALDCTLDDLVKIK